MARSVEAPTHRVDLALGGPKVDRGMSSGVGEFVGTQT
jgi:hypothetical protein